MEVIKGQIKVFGLIRPQASLLDDSKAVVARLTLSHFGSKADLWIESNIRKEVVLNHYLQAMLSILDCNKGIPPTWRRVSNGKNGDVRMSAPLKY